MRVVLLVALVAACASSACGGLDPPVQKPFQFYVKVESDPSHPLTGAFVLRNNLSIASTGMDGKAMITLKGKEGDVTDVVVKCPDTFQSPTKPLSVRLTRLAADESKIPEYLVSCPPSTRRVVVAVKADNGPNLPVYYLNELITRTDASGAAHFALKVPPNTSFTVRLDTSENPKLKPPNPNRTFGVGVSDDILVFEQKFQAEKARYVAPRGPQIAKPLN